MTDIRIAPDRCTIAGRDVVAIHALPWPRRSYRMVTDDNYQWDVTIPLDAEPVVELQLLPWMALP